MGSAGVPCPAGFRFVCGGRPTVPWHLYPTVGRRSKYGEATGQALCGQWPHYTIAVGYSIWHHEAERMPPEGTCCRACAAQLRGRALVTPLAEQLRLF
jgi:hypothetical protein